MTTRREFLRGAAAVSAAFAGLHVLFERTAFADPAKASFGPYRPDPKGILDLPDGFTYRVLSRTGDRMSDGLLTPAKPDGMAAFPGEGGRTILLRNHEIIRTEGPGAFGKDNALLATIDRSRLYDAGGAAGPVLGGVTTMVVGADGAPERHWLSLAGTCYNCAGGPTPWGSWLSCEEDVTRAGDGFAKDHGYVFEVRPGGSGLVEPKPITPMGRFRHEAVAVDPTTGIVYLTEDRPDGLIYRYIPKTRGELLAGGTLRALAIKGWRSADVRNWEAATVKVGQTFDTEWIDLDEIDSPKDDLRERGFRRGATRFARSEGMWQGLGAVFFACTNGGKAQRGQIWRYTPSRHEGTPGEEQSPGRLELFVESPNAATMNMCDNITVSPWGDLFVCEDGDAINRVLQVTSTGEVIEFARNAEGKGEFAGGCFSPDGSTFFVNIQNPGITLAVRGRWRA